MEGREHEIWIRQSGRSNMLSKTLGVTDLHGVVLTPKIIVCTEKKTRWMTNSSNVWKRYNCQNKNYLSGIPWARVSYCCNILLPKIPGPKAISLDYLNLWMMLYIYIGSIRCRMDVDFPKGWNILDWVPSEENNSSPALLQLWKMYVSCDKDIL